MNDDTTGPHPIVAATKQEGLLVINLRTIVIAVVALLGGGIGGGSISLAGSNSVPEDVRRDLSETRTSLKELSAQVSTIGAQLARMTASIEAAQHDGARMSDAIGDHETRLRSIERRLR